MIFCGRPDFVNGLLLADIDVVNLANNHSLNWGLEGINQTINLLNQNQIINCGFPINKPGFASIKNTKIAFLGWNLLEEFNQEEILNTIKQVKKQSNLIIVSLHWGTEYTSFPEAWQINLAHQIINAGADLIAGNHPHWIQSIEIYQQKLIIYSHGNFIFDQEWSQQTKTGILAKHTFYQNQLIDSQLFPVFIKDYSQPEILEEKEKQQILEEIKTNSFKLLNLYQ